MVNEVLHPVLAYSASRNRCNPIDRQLPPLPSHRHSGEGTTQHRAAVFGSKVSLGGCCRLQSVFTCINTCILCTVACKVSIRSSCSSFSFQSLMSTFLRIIVLLCYVAGSHALPLLHRHESGGTLAVEKTPASCGCNSRCDQSNPFERGLTVAAVRSVDILDQAPDRHTCSETCAVCIAQVSATGFATCSVDWCIGLRRIPDVFCNGSGTVTPSPADATSPRGPPSVDKLRSFV